MPWVHNTSPGISGSTTRALGPSISEPVRLLLRSAPPVCSVKLRRESKTRWSAGHQPGHQRLLCKAQLTVREEARLYICFCKFSYACHAAVADNLVNSWHLGLHASLFWSPVTLSRWSAEASVQVQRLHRKEGPLPLQQAYNVMTSGITTVCVLLCGDQTPCRAVNRSGVSRGQYLLDRQREIS